MTGEDAARGSAHAVALLVCILVPGIVEGRCQGQAEEMLYRRCDSTIPWISDGTELADGSNLPPKESGTNRATLLEEARNTARERNRLILWYCMRVPGTHTYRAAVLDAYARVVFFTDPGLIDLIRSKFVPLRMSCDATMSAVTGIKALDFVEPGFILLAPDGRIVHRIDRIRTFNADWLRAVLVAALRTNPQFNAPAGSSTEDLIRGGDDDKAFEHATTDQKAVLFRHAGRFEDVLSLDCGALHKGIALLGLRKFEEARAILSMDGSAEALYHLGAVDAWTGKDPEKWWKELVQRHPESPWAWRAASNLVRGRDGLPYGPLAHNFEDFFFRPSPELPSTTRLPARDVDSAAARAVDFLLRSQRPDGTWSDSRYSYGWAAYMIRRRIKDGLLDPGYSSWPDTGLQANVFVAVTALAAQALYEWRELATSRIDEALARADKFLREDDNLAPARCEACYADTYRLMYFAARKDVPRMNRMVSRLAELQERDGFWSHEYPSAFATAAVVRCLSLARKAGAEVPEILLNKAADALLSTRGEGGRQAYRSEPGKGPSSEKNSMGRIASSELALFECGRGSIKNVAAGVETYWKHLARLEAVRTCDNHADEELAGFFYFNAVFHTLEAARTLAEPVRSEQLRRFRAQILALPEWDGSFVDSHELGKSYGSAMALLILNRVR
jgi:hypothetical protein